MEWCYNKFTNRSVVAAVFCVSSTSFSSPLVCFLSVYYIATQYLLYRQLLVDYGFALPLEAYPWDSFEILIGVDASSSESHRFNYGMDQKDVDSYKSKKLRASMTHPQHSLHAYNYMLHELVRAFEQVNLSSRATTCSARQSGKSL